jgi:hypothetical protein
LIYYNQNISVATDYLNDRINTLCALLDENDDKLKQNCIYICFVIYLRWGVAVGVGVGVA